MISNADMQVEDRNAIADFKRMFAEYHEHKTATTAAASTSPMKTTDVRALATIATCTDIVPMQQSPRGLQGRRSMRFSATTRRGFESPDRSDDENTGPPKTTPKKKLTKVQKLEEEGRAKYAVLTAEDWETATCDKNMEGLLKRINNQSKKCLEEECDTDGVKILSTMHKTLSKIYNFGTMYKKQTKRSDMAALQSLTLPMRELQQDPSTSTLTWSPRLQIVARQIDFWSLIRDGMYPDAMSKVNIQELADLFEKSPSHSGNAWVLAIQLSLPMVEKVLIDAVKNLKLDKKQAKASRDGFMSFFRRVANQITHFPKLQTAEYTEKRRAETLEQQVRAVLTLINFMCPEGGQTCVWPSAARDALMILEESPKTRFGSAFDAYSGGKQFIADVRTQVQWSTQDHASAQMVRNSKTEALLAKSRLTDDLMMKDYRQAIDQCTSILQRLAEVLPALSCVAFEEITSDLFEVAEAIFAVLAAAANVMCNDIISSMAVALGIRADESGDGTPARMRNTSSSRTAPSFRRTSSRSSRSAPRRSLGSSTLGRRMCRSSSPTSRTCSRRSSSPWRRNASTSWSLRCTRRRR